MKTILRSDDLSCPSCVPKIEKALGQIDGVTDAKVHFATGRIEVEYDAAGAVRDADDATCDAPVRRRAAGPVSGWPTSAGLAGSDTSQILTV